MVFLKGIECSLLLGPDGEQARQIGEQITTRSTVMTVIEPKPGVFALELRLIGTRELKGTFFAAAVSLDGVFILDRINAREITAEFPLYDFPRIDAADYKENGKWFKRFLTFKTIEPNNIDAQYSNKERNGIIEVKIWRCKVIGKKSKEPDMPLKIGVNNISHHNNTQHSIIVAGLGPNENFTAPRNSKASKSKITDRTYNIAYIDNVHKPYASFKFQYRSNGEAPNRIKDRASDSFSDSGQGFGGESSYHSPSANMAESYAKVPRNTIHRYKVRGKYEYATIHSIVNTSQVLHVSFPTGNPEDPFPAMIPMLGFMASYSDPSASLSEPLDLYIHGYVSSRLFRLGSADQEEGLPLTVAATHLDGLVLALTPNNHSYNYRSAILHGYATPVVDAAEKMWAMEQITNGVVTDRWDNSRVPPTKTEMTSTQILKVRIVDASAKVRAGMPGDDKADLADKELRERTWIGVVPTWTRYGKPIASEENRCATVPSYLTEYVERENEIGEKNALAAATAVKK